MFPPPKDVLKAREGSLAEVPLAFLLHALAVEERTVVLELRKNQLEKRISFEDGVPVGCRSNLLHETLGQHLVERGRLGETQCHEALAQAAREGRPLGEVLVKRGLLTPYDLFRAMQQNMARKVLDAFTWTDAKYRLRDAPDEEETPLKMSAAQLVLTAATTVLPWEVVERGLAIGATQRFARAASSAVESAGLKLQPKDARLLQALQARPTLSELATKTGYSEEETHRRLYAFGVLGLVAFAEEVRDEPVLAPAPAPLAVPEKPENTAPPASDEARRRADEVMSAYLKHRSQDPFELLGVAPTAPVPEIRKAFVSAVERFRPAQFTGELQAVAEKAEELLFASARAFAQLSDAEGRGLAIERRARKAEEAKRRKGDAGQDFRISTGLLDASAQFRQGLARLEARAYGAAIPYFEFACDCDPSKAAYRAHLGWARFLDAPSRTDKALAEIQQALRIDPRCDLAHFFEGNIRAQTGDVAGAGECYRRAIKARPDERRYTEALKAVTLASKRA